MPILTLALLAGLRVATFQCDATPPLGEPMVWDVPLTNVESSLLAKGILLDDGTTRCVLVALDWCLIANESEWSFRELIARAAGTDSSRVAIHTVHQHDAPYADAGAFRLLDAAPHPPPHLSDKFLRDLQSRLSRAIQQATLQPFDHIGCGEARVERVASARRLKGPDGKSIVRGSEGAKRHPEQAAMPEGDIDPMVKTITFARGTNALARLHFYATHPQTVSCDGRATSDFVGRAREDLERREKIFQIYFTGCAGDVTVGKYNDGTPTARAGLADRLRAGMEAAIANSRFVPAERLRWRVEPVTLPIRTDEDGRAALTNSRATANLRIYKGAMRLATAARGTRPFEASALQIGNVHIVNLPGEPFLEFQKFAQRCRQDDFVAVAGYGDAGCAYICTDAAFDEGGYEPTATNLAPGAEQILKAAIRRLLE